MTEHFLCASLRDFRTLPPTIEVFVQFITVLESRYQKMFLGSANKFGGSHAFFRGNRAKVILKRF